MVVRVTRGERPFVLVLDRSLLSVSREAGSPVMEDENVVGENVAETGFEAALGEVDLLAIPGREREIEVPNQLNRAAANVQTMPDRSWEPRVYSQRVRSNRSGGHIDAPFLR